MSDVRIFSCELKEAFKLQVEPENNESKQMISKIVVESPTSLEYASLENFSTGQLEKPTSGNHNNTRVEFMFNPEIHYSPQTKMLCLRLTKTEEDGIDAIVSFYALQDPNLGEDN